MSTMDIIPNASCGLSFDLHVSVADVLQVIPFIKYPAQKNQETVPAGI
jgi:hypothetical protein